MNSQYAGHKTTITIAHNQNIKDIKYTHIMINSISFIVEDLQNLLRMSMEEL